MKSNEIKTCAKTKLILFSPDWGILGAACDSSHFERLLG